MKILLIGCHSIWEYDMMKLFHEMGYKVFSHGAYRNPAGHPNLPRPGISGMEYFPEYMRLTDEHPSKNDIPEELIKDFDIIMVSGGYHDITVISDNWKKFNKKITVWVSIGQSNSPTELALSQFRSHGMKIVRYSPKEKQIPNYMG